MRRKIYKKSNFVLAAIILLAAFLIFFISVFVVKKNFQPPQEKESAVEEYFSEAENYFIPETEEILAGDSLLIIPGSADIPLRPQDSGKSSAVSAAALTMKRAYELSAGEATKWAAGAKLSFIKSFGIITLDGQSGQWQAVFLAKEKEGMAYEIIIQKDKIVSAKEIKAAEDAVGVDLPDVWPDSGDFVKKLQADWNFSGASVNSFLLGSTPESTDAKWWFSLGTSKGVATFEIK